MVVFADIRRAGGCSAHISVTEIAEGGQFVAIIGQALCFHTSGREIASTGVVALIDMSSLTSFPVFLQA